MARTKEKNSLPQRLHRHAKVAGTMTGVAAKVAGEKIFGLTINHEKHAAQLRGALGNLKGPLMKVAQILGTIPDLVPPEYTKELAQLQADAPPMGWLFVKRRMAGELGADWQKKFKNFEQTAAAAASLGQVHRATALDGKLLACKLQYPDMLSAVEADLKQLSVILSVFEIYDRAVSTQEVQREIAERLHEELDYVREAKNICLYADVLKDVKTVHVPEVDEKLSTPRLLTMNWLEGERMMAVAESRKLEARNQIAMNMFHAWYVPFYNYGIIHGDPHLGNYSVRKDNSINLLDFGCIRIFNGGTVRGVIELYHALHENDEERAVTAYKEWGFKNPSKALIEALNIWARFVYAPLLEDRKRLIEETNTGVYGRETAARVHKELRKIGGVVVPREFVFMDRAAIGLGSVFLRLKAEINWYQLFHDLIRDFDVKTLCKNQNMMLKKYRISNE
jgi:predicted unusual protein kinase regulating ubiquinone biosynthesis (AarF/ABC1/UbiB family)